MKKARQESNLGRLAGRRSYNVFQRSFVLISLRIQIKNKVSLTKQEPTIKVLEVGEKLLINYSF